MLGPSEILQKDIKSEREFQRLQRERLKTDQITEASERLNGAMENTFEYTYQNGDLYFQGEALGPIFDKGVLVAEEITRSRPEFATELQRRHIERNQLTEQLALIESVDWQDPLVLVHISPTPDAVLKEGIDLNAYDLERKKIMIRITEPTADGAKVTSMSLDGNDRASLQAVSDFFGVNIPNDASSEDILGMRFLAEKSQFGGERPAKIIRECYDNAMKLQYGGEWYAGRRNSDVLDTMQKIMMYPELIDQHVDEVEDIKSKFGKNFRSTNEYSKATYDFLASVEQADKLGAIVGSMNDAGDIARSAGVEYSKSDCPTGQVLTAEQALEMQGINRLDVWHYGTCQACLENKMVGECSVCASCEHIDDYGGDLMEVRRKALAQRALKGSFKTAWAIDVASIFSSTKASENTPKEKSVKLTYGKNAVLRRRKTVGDEVLEVVDGRTEEILNANLYGKGRVSV